jgi:hypothetical protein
MAALPTQEETPRLVMWVGGPTCSLDVISFICFLIKLPITDELRWISRYSDQAVGWMTEEP